MAVSGGQGRPGGDCDFKLRTVRIRALCSVRLHGSRTPVALRTTYAGPHCILGYPFVPPLLRYWYEGGRARRSNAAFCRKGYSVFHCVLLWHCGSAALGSGPHGGRRHASSPASAAFKRPPPVIRNRSLSRTTPRPVGNPPVSAHCPPPRRPPLAYAYFCTCMLAALTGRSSGANAPGSFVPAMPQAHLRALSRWHFAARGRNPRPRAAQILLDKARRG